jgi:hypothetical protein
MNARHARFTDAMLLLELILLLLLCAVALGWIARLRHAAILAERNELIRLWRESEISDEVMHHLEETLDYQEAHL